MSLLEVERIFVNGRTGDSGRSVALAVAKGRLAAVGAEDDLSALTGPSPERIDLEGAFLLPGIVESHLHFSLLGFSLDQIQAHWRPKEEILQAVADRSVEARRRGDWILGRGWNQEVWTPPLFPTRHELDRIVSDLPVYLERTCCHAAWVNGKALERAGIDAATADPEGGEIVRDERGEPTGLLIDRAMELVTAKIPRPSREGHRRALLKAQERLLALGITTVCDMSTDSETIVLLDDLIKGGAFHLSFHGYGSPGIDGGLFPDGYRSFLDRGPLVGGCDGRLHLAGLKLFADGSLGARSAWMKEDYADRPGHRGHPRDGGEGLYAVMAAATARGFQVATHAIGDAANALVLDLYARLIEEHPQARSLRPRLEHGQNLAEADLDRIAPLGVVASVQPVHATSDWAMAEERLGPHRLAGAYAWRDLLDRGVVIAAGSDAPVESPDPFEGIYAAVTRRDRRGRPEGGWQPRQVMTRREALRAFTAGGAWAVGAEGEKGSFDEGKRADFAVVDGDILTCPEEAIRKMTVLRTVIGGETVFLR
ncbi:MAG: amidohydrolase [Synergistaceae bacterium]|nr:amidohydrolase [Synergistaceae bacterium]